MYRYVFVRVWREEEDEVEEESFVLERVSEPYADMRWPGVLRREEK